MVVVMVLLLVVLVVVVVVVVMVVVLLLFAGTNVPRTYHRTRRTHRHILPRHTARSQHAHSTGQHAQK